MDQAVVPIAVKQLRACLRCKLLLSPAQFNTHGCPNCPQLDMMQNKKKIEEYTTSQYFGMVVVLDEQSWAGKYNETRTPGAYAMKVYGDVPDGTGDGYEEYDE